MNGLELKVKRIRAGLTLWALGQKAGIHPARISEMERNQRPVATHIEEILDEVLEGTPAGRDG